MKLKEKTKEKSRRSDTRDNLVEAAVKLMLQKGFTATSVDEICEASGVTKGSFFHYFKSKEDLAKVAINHYSSCGMKQLEDSPFNALADPLDRLYGYLDYMADSVKDPKALKSCLVGNLTQELALTHPELRSVCAENLSWHYKTVQRLIEDAVRTHPPREAVDAESLAKYLLAMSQGSLILIKATLDAKMLLDNLEHCRRYLKSLFSEKETVR